MPQIYLDSALVGDVLHTDVIVNDVVLFSAGTVLTKERLDILNSVNVHAVSIEERYSRKSTFIEKAMSNIDDRFSYVMDKPLMARIHSWTKDVLANMEEH